LHHVTLQVSDLDKAIRRVKGHKAELVREDPETFNEIRSVFVHPRFFSGVMLELCEGQRTGSLLDNLPWLSAPGMGVGYESDLTGKVAFIFGSTKGIGKAIALKLAQNGSDIILNGRSRRPLLWSSSRSRPWPQSHF